MLQSAKHIFKLDPDKEIDDDNLTRICESGTDLIIVGGTDGVTETKVLNLLARVRRFFVPVALEISNTESVVPGFDHYIIPAVINTKHLKYRDGILIEALKAFDHLIDFDELTLMPYLIFNENCKAFKHAECTPITDDYIKHYVQLIDKMYAQKYMYIEFSGTLADVKTLETIHRYNESTHIIYGGGIQSREDFVERVPFADSIVVGNLIYEDIEAAINTVN